MSMTKWAARLKTSLRPHLGGLRRELKVAPSLFDGFRDETLRKIAPRIARTRFHDYMEGVDGWLTPRERQTLYAFGRWHPGPFLEIGSWVGLSTCHIAAGVRDSGRRKTFVTCDLDATAANFRPIDDDKMGFYYPADSTVLRGICSLELYHRDIEPIIGRPGGVVGTLRENLDRMELADFVQVHVGHFSEAPKHDYRFVFSDAMHDPTEIAHNVPYLQPLLSPGVLLACHDATYHPDNIAALRQSFSYGHTLAMDSLFIGEIV